MGGLVTLACHFGPQETMDRLETAIRAKGMTVFARINHAALAAEGGLTLGPTEVIIFGNPRAGTPLMQANQTIGLDLPLKALVWQDASEKVWLTYSESTWLAKRHAIEGVEGITIKIDTALRDIASQITSRVT